MSIKQIKISVNDFQADHGYYQKLADITRDMHLNGGKGYSRSTVTQVIKGNRRNDEIWALHVKYSQGLMELEYSIVSEHLAA